MKDNTTVGDFIKALNEALKPLHGSEYDNFLKSHKERYTYKDAYVKIITPLIDNIGLIVDLNNICFKNGCVAFEIWKEFIPKRRGADYTHTGILKSLSIELPEYNPENPNEAYRKVSYDMPLTEYLKILRAGDLVRLIAIHEIDRDSIIQELQNKDKIISELKEELKTLN